jgi:hypothetical protein
MIDLTTCVKGQKLRLRNGRIAIYIGLTLIHCYPHKTVSLKGEGFLYTYKDNGSYHSENESHTCDVIEILPLETTKPASHPSVAWWESCPWITDRKPTEEDGNHMNQVLVHLSKQQARQRKESFCFMSWEIVRSGEAWIHHGNWQPPVLSDKEKALELINNHEDGWRPTTEQWLIIRKGLEAS